METTKDNLIISKSIADDIIQQLKDFSSYNSMKNSLFVVGSYCRSQYMSRPWLSSTLEISSPTYDNLKYVGSLFSTEVLQINPLYVPDKKVISISYKDIVVEFQGYSVKSHMLNKEILDWMQKASIPDIPLMHNVYGRDFTVNGLIMSVDDGNIYDPTGRAASDIRRELISSLLPPALLIKNNPKAILEAIELSLSLDFYIENNLSLAMKDGAHLLFESLSHDKIIEHIVDILKLNATRGLDMLKRYNLDEILLHPDIKEMVYNAKHSR